MKKTFFIIAGMLMSLLGLNGQNATGGYKVVQKIQLTGDGGWDYLNADDATGMLYVSHGKMVNVVDMKTGKEVATITDVNGVHGIAIAPDLNKGFISNGPDSNVTVFNTKDYSIIEKVQVTGKNPDAILYEPFTKTIITWKVEQTWSIAPGEEPSGLALDNETHRLFSATSKLMVVLDAETGKVITTLPTGDRVDGAGFDPGLKRAYSSCGEGLLTVVQEQNKDSFKVLANIPTQAGAKTISVSSKTHRVYF